MLAAESIGGCVRVPGTDTLVITFDAPLSSVELSNVQNEFAKLGVEVVIINIPGAMAYVADKPRTFFHYSRDQGEVYGDDVLVPAVWCDTSLGLVCSRTDGFGLEVKRFKSVRFKPFAQPSVRGTM